ncbi:hypothetical protein T06_8501 [Trichinella sp. T6]|nr:hypothetical protein T06_8501 [Trichinella sp. T6]
MISFITYNNITGMFQKEQGKQKQMESSVNTETSEYNQDTVREVQSYDQDSFESDSLHPEEEVYLGDNDNPTLPLQQHSVLTDTIVVRHPRSIIICAAIQLCLAIQILIFAIICHFYDGCPYKSSLWMSTIFCASAILGIVFVKLHPKRMLLLVYTGSTLSSIVLSVILFAITAWLLDKQERTIRQDGWRHSQPLFELNRMVENTIIAMYTLHMVFTPAHGVCAIVSLILCYYNVVTPEEELHKGYYVSRSAFGHQTVLVPLSVRTGANLAGTNETAHLLTMMDQNNSHSKGTQTPIADRSGCGN